MQRTAFILACFVICTTSLAQQYPFVHYTPKDGLISNQIKSIYQDSKGRLYFPSMNGLSIYDGSRFINYTQENGLNLNIINQVMEMGDDSIWIITNSKKINCLVNGKMKTLALESDIIINHLSRNEKGDLYAASEQGLYIFDKDCFIQLPLTDTYGRNIDSYIAYALPIGDHLLLQRDYGLLDDLQKPLYLFNTITKKIVAEIPFVSATSLAPDGRIWASTEKKIMSLDIAELKKGKIVFEELPAKYASLKNLGKYFIQFDRSNNCWLGNGSTILIKAEPDGNITYFPKTSGLSMHYINSVFQDREGISWIATNNGGVNKLVHSNFSFSEKPFNISPPFGDVYYNEHDDQLLFYTKPNAIAVFVKGNKQAIYNVTRAEELHGLIETRYGIFGRSSNQLFKMIPRGNTLYPEAFHPTSTDNLYGNAVLDKSDNLIVCGNNYITAIVNGKIISQKKLSLYADRAVTDARGNIWVVTRLSDLTMYRPRPDNPSDYLEEKLYFKKELSGIAARTMIIDRNNNIWIGSRSNGVHVFRVENGNLVKKFNLTKSSGLSDDFISYLECDRENNIWACSPLGLDKIKMKNGSPVIENLTKQNNIYQSVFKVVIDKDNTVWATVSNGLIRITPEKGATIDYSPALMVSLMKTGKDTINDINAAALSHKQNNLTFYFGATSFFDEKQILYSYRLLGGSNNQWSEPSNNATVSFIDLPPGDYRLEIKAKFPAGRYPEKTISHRFSIAPAWWQTWWFRSVSGLLIIALLIIAVRSYYRRKLEKQMVVLEKQQAIEKERTRIATDMHDDLGAGLSRIKFLSETIGIKKQQHEPIEEDVNKIREYSHEMIDKMGEIVWALNEKNDSLSDLLSYTRAYAVEYLAQNGVNCKAELPDLLPSVFVSGEFRRNVFLTVKEALHNVVKHSQASEVTLTMSVNHHLSIKVKDNGSGIDKNKIRPFSNGLANMESRVKEIGGRIEIENKNGTLVNLSIPLKT